MAVSSPPQSSTRLPELFGKTTQLVGWQGITAIVPETWSLVAFGGDRHKGNLRLADEDGLRLEVLWEKPKQIPDVERSVQLLLDNIEKNAKKKKHEVKVVDNPKLVSRSRKEHADKVQLTNFGWLGEPDQTVSHGFGAAWFCEETNRVLVAHAVGTGTDNPEKTRRLAAEVLSSFQSHGTGGWQTWSAFGLQFEMPEEFALTTAKLQTGRMELDFERVVAHEPMRILSPKQWAKRPERVGVRRISAANVVLEHESLENWALRVATPMWKKFRFRKFEETTVLGKPGVLFKGAIKDHRQLLVGWLLDRIFRRRTPAPEMTVWHDEVDIKIFVLLCDLWPINAGIKADIIDSLHSRT